MEMQLDFELIKNYHYDYEELLVLEAQRSANSFLQPSELADMANVLLEKAISSVKKTTEIMMLTRLKHPDQF